jgi:2-methylcitrate dehydratase PrpD
MSRIEAAVAAAVGLELDRVSDEVIEHAGRVMADTVAVATAGARSVEIVRLVELDMAEGLVAASGDGGSRPEGRTLSATVLTSPTRRAAPAHAAFLNATSGTFLELDEGMRPTGHPAMHIVPAAIAAAESGHASGEELLHAVLAGYEVTSRLFRAFRLRYPLHPHGHFGAVGAAVAVALLEGADPLQSALIAGTSPLLPVWQACFEGATARNCYTGLAAHSGVRSSALARAGFTGSAEALDVAFGTLVGELIDPEMLTAELNHDDLGISRNYFKRHSACALTHSAIDAVLELDLPAEAAIHHVRVETVANNMKIDRQPQPNDLSGRFSLPYAVATAILLGRSDPEAFRYRPWVAALAERVQVEVAPDLEDQWPESSPARVTVEWSGGTTSASVRNPRGHHTQPMAGAEVHEKFRMLVDTRDRAEAWWARLTSLRDVTDCATLLGEAA